MAQRLVTSIRDGIVVARQKARVIGAARFAEEADDIGIAIRNQASVASIGMLEDWRRGTTIGQSFAARWYKVAAESGERAAAIETGSALERIAITESSHAFSDGRLDAARELSAEVQLMRIWDATLDIRTCPFCEDADGTIVGLLEPFPAGEPGSVHPRCRCGWHLLTMTESKTHVSIRAI